MQQALAASPLFLSAALPNAIYPPLFNRYGPGEHFGAHVDNAIRVDPASGTQMRTDLSATLFLSEDYDGGELTIDRTVRGCRLECRQATCCSIPRAACTMSPGDRGERIALLFLDPIAGPRSGRRARCCSNSTSRSSAYRRTRRLMREVLRLTKVYHNLVRRWST